MRLIDADALLENYDLKNAVKYGNKDRDQQYKSYDTLMMYEVANMIHDAPTIESQRTGWTPCSEGMPEHCSENRVTVLDTRCGARYATNMDYNIHTKKWTNDKANELPSCYSVIAWQPLPAPYRADQKEDNADDHN